MKESEIRELFMVIENAYGGVFVYDDYKVELWRQTLENMRFELAEHNLLAYIRNPENRFPPHPGVLAQRPVQEAIGPYVPNAAETREMLAAIYDRPALPPAPLPPCVAELKARLANGSS